MAATSSSLVRPARLIWYSSCTRAKRGFQSGSFANPLGLRFPVAVSGTCSVVKMSDVMRAYADCSLGERNERDVQACKVAPVVATR